VSPEQAAALIDAIDASDPEVAHSLADGIVLDHADPAIRQAYRRLLVRARWWAFA